MSKKVITIGNKTYIVDSDTKQMEEVESEADVPTEETEKDSSEKDENDKESVTEPAEDIETKINAAAANVVKELGLDDIKNQIRSISDELKSKGKEKESKKISALLNLEALMNKDVSKMTTREKVIGFFQAMVQNNTTVLKALSEGNAADGGYLFPDKQICLAHA